MTRRTMTSTRALVREPGASLPRCELTYLERAPIDPIRARAQHAAYVAALEELGAAATWLPPLDDLPDAVFVEDIVIVRPEVTVLTNPGVASRQAEVKSMRSSLAALGAFDEIRAPGHLDGGDLLVIGRRVLVGLSTRTNSAGVSQLCAILSAHGYTVESVRVTGCLHLKSACTAINEETVLANPAFIDRALLGNVRVLEVDPREPRAANTLTLGGETLVSERYPFTADRLGAAGIRVRKLDVSELEKAEAGLTCMSVLLPAE